MEVEVGLANTSLCQALLLLVQILLLLLLLL